MNENTVKFDKKHFFIVALTIFIFSVCDFLVAYFFQDVLKSPFFFDTIFMIAALFLFGPIASLIEYILFISFTCIKLKILYGKTDFVFLYTLSAFTIILVTWLFIRKKENLNKGLNLTFLYILTASVVAGLSCSVVSGFVNYYFANCLFQIEWNFNIFIFAFNGEYMDLLTSSIIGRIPVTILDRVVTTFLGFGISKLYSRIIYGERAATECWFWFDMENMKKILLLFSVAMLLLSCKQKSPDKIYNMDKICDSWNEFWEKKDASSLVYFIDTLKRFDPKIFNNDMVLKTSVQNQIALCISLA